MSQIIGNDFILNDGLNSTAAPWAGPNGTASGPFPAGSPGYSGYGPLNFDAVRPAWYGSALPGDALNPYATSGIGGVLAQLASQVQQLIAQLSGTLGLSSTPATTVPGSSGRGGAATFQNVSLASAGDPHLSVSGTELNADGSAAAVTSAFDSMTAHPDLFSTRDFGDGFRVSTTVTPAAANGVTQNASATASMDGGRETVTETASGTLTVTDHGQNVALAPGQSVRLSGGQQISETANGAVSVSETAFGESLTTTFTPNGGGVDVTAQGQNVTLAGDLITGGATPVAQAPGNVREPYSYI